MPPPRQHATGSKRYENQRKGLEASLDAAARKAFGSTDVSVERLQFRDPQLGHLGAVLDIVTGSQGTLKVDRFAGGLTAFTNEVREPFETFLRKVLDNSGVDVVVTDAYLEHRPSAAAPPSGALTRTEQRWARWISGVALVLIALFVMAVLHVGPFSLGVVPVGWS
jgi:hypothetical protein